MRIIFIPGFGEDAQIFEKIYPQLPGDKVFVNNWELIGDFPKPELTVLLYARELVARYSISAADVVIGHSMGGWIALHIKQLVGCPIVQIASWTDQRKVVRPLKNERLVYWLIKRGLYLNPLVGQVMIWQHYRNKPSRAIFSTVFRRLSRGNKNNVVNQLRVILAPVDEAVNVQPDLRIHARRDTIVRFPEEAALEVPGDHFTLYTHPEQVYVPLKAFILKQPQ